MEIKRASQRPFDGNPYTRLAIAMCPAEGILRAAGYDVTGAELPEPVTQLSEVERAPSLQPA